VAGSAVMTYCELSWNVSGDSEEYCIGAVKIVIPEFEGSQ
jgi:hypothetical protein